MATNRTALFSRRQPGGVFTVDDLTEHPGDIFFVDSGSAAASDAVGFGKNPDAPFATLDYAVGQCTASNGDVIYVMPGHAETVAAAGGITLDVAGVSIVGLGTGDQQPTVTFATAAAASIVVSADDCYLTNMEFVGNIANQNHMIDLAADSFTVEDCFFREGSATGLTFITADTADGDSDLFVCRGNLFYAPTAGNFDSAICLGKDHWKWLIEDNDIYGDFDDAAIEVPAGGDASGLLRIYRNRITNLQAGDHAIQISGATVTGWAVDNQLQTDAQATAFDSSALSCHGNTWVDTDGNNDEEAVPANTQHATTTALVGLQAGAIAAATFAANAIAAASIAANAITATAIAGDAITNAKIADAALAYEQYDLDAPVLKTVKKADFPLDGGSVADVFTIGGGPIQLVALFTHLTEAVSAHACAVKWQIDPTSGAANTDICGTVDINAFAIGDVVYVTGASADAAVRAANATAIPLSCAVPAMLLPGGVDFVAANANPTSGIADVYLVYRPLAQGVTVTAA